MAFSAIPQELLKKETYIVLEASKMCINTIILFWKFKFRNTATYNEVIDPVSVIQVSMVRESIFCYQNRRIVVFLSYPVEGLSETPWNHLKIFSQSFIKLSSVYRKLCPPNTGFYLQIFFMIRKKIYNYIATIIFLIDFYKYEFFRKYSLPPEI